MTCLNMGSVYMGPVVRSAVASTVFLGVGGAWATQLAGLNGPRLSSA